MEAWRGNYGKGLPGTGNLAPGFSKIRSPLYRPISSSTLMASLTHSRLRYFGVTASLCPQEYRHIENQRFFH